MSNVQVLHIEKRMSIAAGLNRHITRVQWVKGELVVWVPCNADPERTKDNVELVSRKFTDSQGMIRTLSLQEAVNKRIKEAGIKPRKTQSRCLEMIFSGSPEVLCNMSREQVLSWAKDTLEWAQKTWGKENVVSASLHLDEKTPHIHMIVVPIVQGQSRRTKKQKQTDKEKGVVRESYKIDHNKLRLCVNEVYTTPLLYYYHDHYALEVSNKYGLERGLRAEPGSKKRHQTSEDYNRQLAAEAQEKRSLIADLQADYNTKKKKAEDAKQQQRDAEERKDAAELHAQELESKVKELNDQLSYVEHKLKTYQNIEISIENRQEQLRALKSYGLLKLIEKIPDMIKKEVQQIVNIYWRGELLSCEEFDDKVDGGTPEKFIRVHMQLGDSKYEFEVRESNGRVWYHNQWHKWSDTKEDAYMPELASYFRQTLLPETKEFVETLFKKVGSNVEQVGEVVWEYHRGIIEQCRIVRQPNGECLLQEWVWDTSKVNEEGRYYARIWEKKERFKSFVEIGRDDNYAYLKLIYTDGREECVNQYGRSLSYKELARLGLAEENGISL